MNEHPNRVKGPLERFFDSVYTVIDGPVTFFREKIVEPNQKKYPYYHQKFRRVPTIDECEINDPICHWEAQQQFNRDRAVDSEILSILRQRHEHCLHEDINQREEPKCEAIFEYYKQAEEAWFTKYGDLGTLYKVEEAFMKQKHRMAWERRHGPVGTGMKNKDVIEPVKEKTHLWGEFDPLRVFQTYKTEDGQEYFREYKPRANFPWTEEDQYSKPYRPHREPGFYDD